MKWLKILLGVIGVVVLVMAGLLIFFTVRVMTSTSRKAKNYIESEAVIMEVHRTGVIVDNRTGLKILLRVEPPNGKTFDIWVEDAVYSPDVYLYKKGVKVRVWYDPGNLKHTEIIRGPDPDNNW